MGILPVASAGVPQVAGYSNLGTGVDGDVKYDTVNQRHWKYNDTVSLWMPTDVQPTALTIDFDGSDVPAGATFGSTAWSTEGTEGSASADGVLTITDDGGSYLLFQGQESNDIVNTNNLGVLARMQVASENTTVTGFKAMISLRPSSEKAGSLTVAGGADGVGGAAQIYPFTTAAGGSLTGVPTYSADNSAYQIYYIFWNKTTKKYTMGVLGDVGCEYKLDTAVFTTNYIDETTAAFGTFHGTGQVTLNVDYFKVFTF